MHRYRRELLPSPKSFYEQQFGQLRRVSRGWCRARCIFHADHDPSLAINLTTGGFHCFSCGEHGGDLVAFVMLRDNVDFKIACQVLGCWDGGLQISKVVIREREREQVRREQERHRGAELEREYYSAERWLYRIEQIYRESNERLSELRKGAAPAFGGEEEVHWHILALALDEVREAEAQFVRARIVWPNAPRNWDAEAHRESRP